MRSTVVNETVASPPPMSGTDTIRATSSLVMRTRRDPAGMIVWAETPASAMRDAVASGTVMAADAGLSGISYLVSSQGQYLRLVDAAPFRALMDSIFRLQLAQAPAELRPRAEGLLARMMTDSTITAASRSGWNVLVGAWAGTRWKAGQSRDTSIVAGNPLTMRGAPVLTPASMKLEGRVPCTPASTGRDCVLLTIVERPDMRASLIAMMREFSAGDSIGGDSAFRASMEEMFPQVAMERWTSIVTHSETLMPESVEVTTRMTMTSPMAPEPFETLHFSRRTYTHHTGDRAPDRTGNPRERRSP